MTSCRREDFSGKKCVREKTNKLKMKDEKKKDSLRSKNGSRGVPFGGRAVICPKSLAA